MDTSVHLEYPVPRALRACENCRRKKARCLSSEQNGSCDRCLKSGMECNYPAENRGNGQRRSGNSSPMGDSLSAILGRKSASPGAEVDTSVRTLENFHSFMIGQLVPGPLTPSSQQKPDPPVPIQPSVPPYILPQLRQLISDPSAIKMYLTRFEAFSPNFPFIELPENWTVESLSHHRPFLVLGMLCATCRSNPLLHYRLNCEFKEALSDRVLVRGQASLDLLQGILVYIAWYPLHLNPSLGQLFQYLHIAGSMMQDLRDRHPEELNACRARGTWPSSRDSHRTFLGCFYLLSALAISRRPNKVPFDTKLQQWASNLELEISSQSDRLCGRLIEIQVLIDEIVKYSTNDGSSNLWGDPLQNICSQEYWMHRLREVEARVDAEELDYPSLRLLRSTVLLRIFGAVTTGPLKIPSVDNISHCLQAAKSSLQTFRDFDDTEIKTLSTVEWFRFISATIAVFSIIATARDNINKDSLIRQQVSGFQPILRSLCERFGKMSRTRKKDSKEPPDVYCLMESVFGIVVKIFEQQIDATKPARANNNPRLFCPVLNGEIRGTSYWDIWKVFTASAQEGSRSE